MRYGRLRAVFLDERYQRPYPIRAELEPLLSANELPPRLRMRGMIDRAVYLNEQRIEINVGQLRDLIDCEWSAPLDELESNVGTRNDNERVRVGVVRRPIIRGIIYRHPVTGALAVRDSHLRDILSSEFHQPEPAPDSLDTIKLFLDLYYDDFGVYRNVYNGAGGVYLVIGNLPLEARQKLRNIFNLGLIPAGVSFEDFISPFVRELHDLQKGERWTVNGKDVWVMGGTIIFVWLYCLSRCSSANLIM